MNKTSDFSNAALFFLSGLLFASVVGDWSSSVSEEQELKIVKDAFKGGVYECIHIPNEEPLCRKKGEFQ